MVLHSLSCCCPYFLICVGTLNKLDGELVVLDGVVYQQAASGACRVVGPEEKVGASHARQPLAHHNERHVWRHSCYSCLSVSAAFACPHRCHTTADALHVADVLEAGEGAASAAGDAGERLLRCCIPLSRHSVPQAAGCAQCRPHCPRLLAWRSAMVCPLAGVFRALMGHCLLESLPQEALQGLLPPHTTPC